MSTRCQVQVRASGLSYGKELISLYHHCDGYPTYMLPLILKARNFGHKDIQEFQFGRPGHVAAFLCATDPCQFEPEHSAELHGDIEWLYIVEAQNFRGGSMAEIPVWHVSVYRPGDTLETSTLLAQGPIETLVNQAEHLERAA